jgi:hypothetical protein
MPNKRGALTIQRNPKTVNMGWMLYSSLLGTAQFPQQRNPQSSIVAHQGKREIARRLAHVARDGFTNFNKPWTLPERKEGWPI